MVVFDAPSGTVSVEVRQKDRRGQEAVVVRPGETVSLEVVLEATNPDEAP